MGKLQEKLFFLLAETAIKSGQCDIKAWARRHQSLGKAVERAVGRYRLCEDEDFRRTARARAGEGEGTQGIQFEHIRESGVRLGALGDYMEGPPPYNALIRNCRFSDCGTGVSSWIRMCDREKTKWSKDLASPMRGIEIEGCSFEDCVSAQVSLKNATQK